MGASAKPQDPFAGDSDVAALVPPAHRLRAHEIEETYT